MPEVVALAPGGEAPVLLGDRQPEAADLGQPEMISSGMSVLAPVHVLGVRADLLVGETVEGLAHQLEVLVEVRGRPRRSASEARKAGSRNVATNASAGAIQSAARHPTPPLATRWSVTPDPPGRRRRRRRRCGPRCRRGRRRPGRRRRCGRRRRHGRGRRPHLAWLGPPAAARAEVPAATADWPDRRRRSQRPGQGGETIRGHRPRLSAGQAALPACTGCRPLPSGVAITGSGTGPPP